MEVHSDLARGSNIKNKEYNPEEVYRHVLAVEKASNAIRAVIDTKIAENPEMHPLSVARDVCLSLLKGSSAFNDVGLEGRHARGCVAEVLLEKIMNIWLREYHIPGIVVSNSMLKVYPRTPSREETTQLDLVTVTDKIMLVCECKSYAGEKTTDGEIVKTKDMDLYPWKQNRGHITAIKNNLTNIGIILPEIYNVVYFFAEGKFTEWQRPAESQDILLVNYGCLSTLNKLYNNSRYKSDSLSADDLANIRNFLQSTIPTVEEQADHILRLNKII